MNCGINVESLDIFIHLELNNPHIWVSHFTSAEGCVPLVMTHFTGVNRNFDTMVLRAG